MIEETYQKRIKICKDCPLFSENLKRSGWDSLRVDEHCTDCGCTLSAKGRCLSCKCTKDKWLAVIENENE